MVFIEKSTVISILDSLQVVNPQAQISHPTFLPVFELIDLILSPGYLMLFTFISLY